MSNIPFKVKLLTLTAKAPERANEGDLWDLFADNFSSENLEDIIDTSNEDIRAAEYRHVSIKEGDFETTKYLNINHYIFEDICRLFPGGRILIKTGLAIELPIQYDHDGTDSGAFWSFEKQNYLPIKSYAVADIRPRSGLPLRMGLQF